MSNLSWSLRRFEMEFETAATLTCVLFLHSWPEKRQERESRAPAHRAWLLSLTQMFSQNSRGCLLTLQKQLVSLLQR